jgi:hypothetical protein
MSKYVVLLCGLYHRTSAMQLTIPVRSRQIKCIRLQAMHPDATRADGCGRMPPMWPM